jgi:thiol reductant ABC exporter CydD subunit
LRRVRAVRAWLAASVLIGLGLTGCLVAQALLLAQLLARLFHRPVSLDDVAPELVSLLAVTVVRSLLLATSATAGAGAANRVRSELRRDALAAVLERGPAWLADERAGELAVSLGRGLDELDVYVGDYLPRLVLAVLGPVVLLGVIAGLDWLSFVILLVVVALVPVFMVLVGRLTQARVERRWAALTALGAHFLDVVEGLATLRAFGRAKRQESQIAEVTDELRHTTMAVLREAFLSALVLETLAAVGTALVAVPLALRLVDGRIALAPAISVLVLTPEVFLPLRRASADFHASAGGLSATDRVFEILEPCPSATAAARRPTPATEPVAASTRRAGLVLAGVRVSYAGRDRPGLDRVDLEVRPGERVALVGASGAGKSTLLAAVLGLVPLGSGSVRLGDLCQEGADLERWRARFAYVPQRPRLFAGTVADNLRLGSSAPRGSTSGVADHDELLWAIEVAQLGAVVARLADGVDSELGESAQRLSTGERQRLAIARALLRRDAEVLLLDEPTAHLDGATETALVAALDSALGDRSLIVATHRSPVVELADQVVVLADGAVVDARRVRP